MDTKITVVGATPSVLTHILSEIRDKDIQQDPLRFRHNLERASGILAYEISKELPFKEKEVVTPLGELDVSVFAQQPVIVSILRAGVPMHNGFLNYFDRADNGFISAYRHHTQGNEFIVKVEYQAMPSIEGRSLIIVDPMIATGRSLVLCYEAMVDTHGKPDQIFVAAMIGSEQGVEYVSRKIPEAKIYLGALDNELTAKAYIVPGLGDAGDLAFGPKV